MRRLILGLLYGLIHSIGDAISVQGDVVTIPQIRVGLPYLLPYRVTYDDNTQSPEIIVRIGGGVKSPLVYEETLDQYTVTTGIADKYYYYVDVSKETGELVTTNFVAREGDRSHFGKVSKDAAGISQRILRSTKRSESVGPAMTDNITNQSRRKSIGEEIITSGTAKNIVVLFKFSDHQSRPVPSKADIDMLMNSGNPDPILCPTGSVKDFFLNNSFGKYSLESTIPNWVTISKMK